MTMAMECPASTDAWPVGIWSVACVIAKKENHVSDLLWAMGFAVNTPCVMRMRADGHGKYRPVARPAFEGYLFACGAEQLRPDTRTIPQLLSVIPIRWQEKFDRELRQVTDALSIDPTLGIYGKLKVGSPCRVIGGPFKGLTGHVEHIGERHVFTIRLSQMQASIPVTIPAEFLEES